MRWPVVFHVIWLATVWLLQWLSVVPSDLCILLLAMPILRALLLLGMLTAVQGGWFGGRRRRRRSRRRTTTLCEDHAESPGGCEKVKEFTGCWCFFRVFHSISKAHVISPPQHFAPFGSASFVQDHLQETLVPFNHCEDAWDSRLVERSVLNWEMRTRLGLWRSGGLKRNLVCLLFFDMEETRKTRRRLHFALGSFIARLNM